MKLSTVSFRGMAPRVTPRALPPNGAQRALNTQLLTGDLMSWRRPGFVDALQNPGSEPVRSIFKLADYWLSFTEEVEFARGTIPGDTTYRTYITGLDVPRFTTLAMATATGSPPYPAQTRPLGVPGPDTEPEAVASIVEPVENALALVNPGAELGNTVGWTADTGGMVALEDGDVPGLDAQAGSWFFGGGAVPESVSHQDVNLAGAGVITGQGLTLRWWQATGADGDLATMAIEFYSEAMVLISSIEEPLQAPDDPLTWVERTLSTQVPDGAATARLVQRFSAVTGGATADAYIDSISLAAIDYSNSFDGSTLSGWTVSPNQGSTSSDRHRMVMIDNTVGWPAPSFYMRGDERVPYFYRSFSTNQSPSVTLTFDWMEDRTRTNGGLHVVPYASASGAATSVFFSTWGGVRLYSHPSWDGIGASLEQVASPGFVTDRRYTATITATLLSATQARLTITVVDTVTGTTVVDAVQTTIPVDGAFLGFKGGPADLHNIWWIDNVTVTIAAPDPADGEDPVYANYVYTFVNDLGEESVPSDPSDTIQRNDNATVTVTTPTTTPTGYDDYAIEFKRIYRATTGAGGTVYRFVAEIPLAQADYIDTLRDDQLGEELESQDYDLPPSDLRYILALPNGIMVGASKNRLCFSEQNRPHAWPVPYRLTTDTDITGLGNVDNTVVVGTQSWVYGAVGNSPGGYTMSKPTAPFACKSARGIASLTRFGVVFPGPDGLMAARGPTDVRNITEALFTDEQWKALDPESILGVAKDDIYFFSWGTAEEGGTFALDLRETGFGLIELSMHASAMGVDLLTDALNFVLDAYYEPGMGESLLSIDDASAPAEDGAVFTLTITRTGDTAQQSIVSWAISGDVYAGTGTDGFEHDDGDSGTLTFGVGEATKQLQFTLHNSGLSGDEFLATVTLSDPSAGTSIVDGVGVLTGTLVDPFWDQVIYLHRYNDLDNPTTLTDEQGNTWTRSTGNPGDSALQADADEPPNPKWPPGSLYGFNILGHVPFMTFGYNEPLDASGQNKFTIDGWASTSATGISGWGVTTNIGYLRVEKQGTALHLRGAFSTGSFDLSGSIANDVYAFWEANFDGTTLRLFINGALVDSEVFAPGAALTITNGRIGGSSMSPGDGFWFDESRFTAGVCRHPSDATYAVPTGPFPGAPA